MDFRGRAADLAVLEQQLREVAEGAGGTRGRAVIMTGRRRVGTRLAVNRTEPGGRS